MKATSRFLALGSALALAGCISFGAKPPETLMRLTAADSVAAQSSRTAPASEAITVVTPTLPQELQTPRVPVRTGETSVAYLKDAQWVEIPGSLFGRRRRSADLSCRYCPGSGFRRRRATRRRLRSR